MNYRKYNQFLHIKMATIKSLSQLTLLEQLQRITNRALDAVGIKPNSKDAKFMANSFEAAQLEAVQQNGEAIRFIKNPSEAVQMEAVKQNGFAIQFIEKPTEAVQMAAVQENGVAIEFIKNPSEEIKMTAVQENGWAIGDIENPSEALQLAAVQQDGWAIQHIANPSEAIQLAAVQQDADAIEDIEHPTEKVQLAAVKKKGFSIYHIANPSEEVELAAVQENGWAIEFIENPSEAVQLAAIQHDPSAIVNIEAPSSTLCAAAIEKEFPEVVLDYANPEKTKEFFQALKAVSTTDRKKVFEMFEHKLSTLPTKVEAIRVLQGNAPEQILEKRFEHIGYMFPNADQYLHDSINDAETGIKYNEPRMLSDNHEAKIGIQKSAQSFADEIKKTLSPEELLRFAKEIDSATNLPLGVTPTIEDAHELFSHPYTQSEFTSAVFINEDAGRYEIQMPSFKYQNRSEELLHTGTHSYSPNYKETFSELGFEKEFSEFEKACCERNQWNNSYSYYAQTHDITELYDLESKLPNLDKNVENSRKTIHNKLIAVLGKDINLQSLEERQLAAVKQDGEAIQHIDHPSVAVQLEAVQQNSFTIQHIMNPSEAVQLEAVKRHGEAIQHIENPSEEVQIAAVRKDPFSIQFIENSTEAVQLAAVQENGWAIGDIKNPSEAIQIEAVQENGYSIGDIENPSEAVQIAAVQRHGWAIQHIENPSETVQLEAVKKNGEAIRHIENPAYFVQLEAVKQNGHSVQFIKDPSESMQLLAVNNAPNAIEFIDNPTEAVQLISVQQDGHSIGYIENPSETVQLEAVKQSGEAIRHIENPSQTVQMEAVKRNGWVIGDIKNPSEELQMEAVKYNGETIRYITNPSEAIQMEAVKQNWQAIRYMKNPSEAVQMAAVQQYSHSIIEITNPSEEVQMEAVKKNGHSVQFIENPSEKVKMAAVEESGWAIQHIPNPSESIQMAAVKKSARAIEFIKNPTAVVREKAELEAIKQEGWAIGDLKNPSDEVQLEAVKQSRISAINISSLQQGGFAISCKIDGVQQPAIKMSKDDVNNFSEKTDRLAMAEKYFQKEIENNPVEEIKKQLVDLRIPDKEQEKYITELLESGKTSTLVPIQTSVLNQNIAALVRLSAGVNDAGKMMLNLHFIRQNLSNDLEQPFMGYTFSEEQKQKLLSTQNAGETIQVTNSKGITKMALVSVDRLTGELVAQPVEKVLIPDTFRGVRLTEEDKLTLKTGKPLTIENVRAKQNTSYSVTVQYNADFKKVVSLPNSNKITIVGGSTLSQKESEELRNGKTIQVSNMIDDKGEKYAAFVRISHPKEEIVITPTNEHKVQISHNNHGEKTEKNKRLEKSRGQSSVKSGTNKVKRTKRGIN